MLQELFAALALNGTAQRFASALRLGSTARGNQRTSFFGGQLLPMKLVPDAGENGFKPDSSFFSFELDTIRRLRETCAATGKKLTEGYFAETSQQRDKSATAKYPGAAKLAAAANVQTRTILREASATAKYPGAAKLAAAANVQTITILAEESTTAKYPKAAAAAAARNVKARTHVDQLRAAAIVPALMQSLGLNAKARGCLERVRRKKTEYETGTLSDLRSLDGLNDTAFQKASDHFESDDFAKGRAVRKAYQTVLALRIGNPDVTFPTLPSVCVLVSHQSALHVLVDLEIKVVERRKGGSSGGGGAAAAPGGGGDRKKKGKEKTNDKKRKTYGSEIADAAAAGADALDTEEETLTVDEVGRFKVAELKAHLKRRKLAGTGNKSKLQERLLGAILNPGGN